jgi:ABC-type ATPase with predicted acetyltransferase domain
MLGFSFPKLMLLLVILVLVWNIFKFLENKTKKSNHKETERNNINDKDEEALTECTKCGGFFNASYKNKCPICLKKD